MYDDRILQMDGILKQILLTLKAKGYLKDYLAVLTADHGQLLGEKDEYGHGYYVPMNAIHVPLIFFGSKPLPIFPQTRFAQQLDVSPTLVDLAGLKPPSSWQGQSLMKSKINSWSYHLSPSNRPGAEGAVVYFDSDKLLKYSRPLVEFKGNPETLYDLFRDPKENNNLIPNCDPNLLSSFREKANEHFSTY